ELSKNQINDVRAELGKLKRDAAEKDSLIKSIQLQLSDAKPLSAVAHSVKDALPEPWLKNMGISCTLVHHMLLHCGTAVWSKQASRPNQCLVCNANKCMGPPDNAVDCDMIDVQNQSGTFSAKFYKKFMQLLVPIGASSEGKADVMKKIRFAQMESKKHLNNSLRSSSQNSESSDTQELDLELRLSL
ncbi:hypothetical protein Gotur_023431, partial [Gossypium turneri]